jgi:hypothetical protein
MEHLKPIDEVNPYASPAGAGGYDPERDRGVGVWSDGKLLVMHPQATLPPICIATGQPATRWLAYDLAWYYPIDWSHRHLKFNVPLCEASYRRWKPKVWTTVLILLPLLACVVGAFFFNAGSLCGLAFAGFMIWALIQAFFGKRLRFERVRAGYLWITGASPEFLRQLPPWTVRTES